MKRKLHLLKTLLVAVGMCAGSMSAWATDWYTSGSTVAAGSDYYLYNIGAGKFLDNGMNWGTRATVDNAGQNLTLAAGATAGTFTIKTNLKTADSMGNGDWCNDGYMDGVSSVEFKFNAVTVSGYTNVYTIQVNSNNKYLVYDNTVPAVNAVDALSGTNNDYWLLIPKTARQTANDYTYLMKNASMNTPWEHHVWTAEGYFEACNFSGGNTANKCAEVYNGIFDFYQQITGVPDGKYTLNCQGFYRGTESTLYANGATVAMKNITSETGTVNWMEDASSAFTEGKYQNTLNFVVANGTIHIGIQKLTTAWADWNIFTNFKLTRTGDATNEEKSTAISTAYTWAANRVTTAKDHFAMEADKRTALGTALTTYSSASAENVTGLLTAYNTALYDGAQIGATGLTADACAIISLDNTVEFRNYLYTNGSATNTWDDINKRHSAYEVAKIQAASSNDYTPMIRNAAVTIDKYGWWGTVTDNGSVPYTGAPDNIYLAHETKPASTDPVVAAEEYNVNQAVYGLPAGKYEATTWTYSSAVGDRNQYIAILSPWTDINVPEKGGTKEIINATGWVKATSTFILAEPSDVAFGFVAAAVNRTAGFDNWTLTRTGDAVVTKSISAAGWATYCSPFALDLEHATGLEDAYIVTGGKNGVLNKSSVKGGTVPAYTGLLLKGAEGTATIPVVATSTTDVTGNKLVGKTATYNLAANDGYVLMASPSLGFYKNENDFTVGANTAYLPADFDSTGGAPAFFSLEGNTTGINSVKTAAESTANEYYNLAGQRVAQPTKGLYIVNGKKVIVK